MKYYHKNPRQITDKQLTDLDEWLEELGDLSGIVHNLNTDEVVCGNQRVRVMGLLDAQPVITERFDPPTEQGTVKLGYFEKHGERYAYRAVRWTERQCEKANIVSNKAGGEFDFEALQDWGLDEELLDWGFEVNELEEVGFDLGTEGLETEARSTLAERFIVPPFSILDTRQGYWQERKRAWLGLGIQSETGRGKGLLDFSRTAAITVGGSQPTENNRNDTSIFGPALCELAYTWFCPPDGIVLDPFAGGSVRGIVATYLGRRYVGIELRSEQVEANRVQANEIVPDNQPTWVVGDAANVKDLATGEYDFLFSCPHDLEVYSDLDGELSALGTYDEFIEQYRAIVADCVSMLKDNRFACFVVGDLRDKDGHYRNFVGDTVEAFRDAGLGFYNEIILITAHGSLPIRVGRQFEAGRKVGKTHQNVLVFVKGDWRKATDACGEIEVADVTGEEPVLVEND